MLIAGHGLPVDLQEFESTRLNFRAASMGSFLRSFVRWPKKAGTKSKSALEGPADEKEKPQKSWSGKTVKTQVFPTNAASAIDDFYRHDNELLEFDAEKDYAQVLAEARYHLKSEESPASKPLFWLHSSQKSAVYRELEAACVRETTSSTKPDACETPSFKRWRSLRFWPRSKKHQDRHGMNDSIATNTTSIFATPQHPSFKPPRDHHSYRSVQKGMSGPIYTDGLPSKPCHRPRKSASGPLSAKLLFYGGEKYVPESPYQPLHHHRSFQAYASPLYTG